MTDIKRLKEIEAKLQQEKEVQRDKKEKTIFRVDFSYMNLSAEDTELLKKHVYRQLNKIENGFIMEKFEVLE
jgi:hypothetical protein